MFFGWVSFVFRKVVLWVEIVVSLHQVVTSDFGQDRSSGDDVLFGVSFDNGLSFAG